MRFLLKERNIKLFFCNDPLGTITQSGMYSQHRIQWPGRGEAKEHEIYGAAFGGHLFNDLFL